MKSLRPLFTVTLRRSVLACALALTFLASGRVHAQDVEPPRPRQGYFLSGGTGLSAMKAWDDGDELKTGFGNRLALRFGQLVTRRWGLGLVIDFGSGLRDKVTVGTVGLGIEANFNVVKNFAVRASAGLGVVSIVDEKNDDGKSHGGYGTQYGLGFAYDLFTTRGDRSGGFAITPTIDLRAIPGSGADSIAAIVGVEFVWWTGLPRNQLELPESDAYKK